MVVELNASSPDLRLALLVWLDTHRCRDPEQKPLMFTPDGQGPSPDK